MLDEKITILCDFDGTASPTDVGAKIVGKFAGKDYDAICDKWYEWADEKIGSKEVYEFQYSLMDIKKDDFNDFVDEYSVCKTFPSLAKLCEEENIPLKLVSDGNDYYIKRILEKENLVIETYANSIEFNCDKIDIDFPHHNEDCGKCGNCKRKIVEHYQKDSKVIFIGNGKSDRCACHVADIVFAKSELIDYCNDQEITMIEFEDFGKVEDLIRRMNKGSKK